MVAQQRVPCKYATPCPHHIYRLHLPQNISKSPGLRGLVELHAADGVPLVLRAADGIPLVRRGMQRVLVAAAQGVPVGLPALQLGCVAPLLLPTPTTTCGRRLAGTVENGKCALTQYARCTCPCSTFMAAPLGGFPRSLLLVSGDVPISEEARRRSGRPAVWGAGARRARSVAARSR